MLLSWVQLRVGNIICRHDENVMIDNAIADMNRRLNNLFAEFSHCDNMDVKRGDIMATIWINCTPHGERQFAEFGNTI